MAITDMLLSYLEAAIAADVGYELKSPEPNNLRTKLYLARQRAQKHGNFAYDELSFFLIPDDTIWIVKHSALERWRIANGLPVESAND